jgi:hypothetical protein
MATPREVKAKKRCCQSGPRCKKCPVVLKRLAADGYAERTGKRTYVVDAPKKVVKAARAKRLPAARGGAAA